MGDIDPADAERVINDKFGHILADKQATEIKIPELKKEAYEFKRDIVVGAENFRTGKTMAENLADIEIPEPDGTVVRQISSPLGSTGGITILGGSLAPEGAVVKNAGVAVEVFEGEAEVETSVEQTTPS